MYSWSFFFFSLVKMLIYNQLDDFFFFGKYIYKLNVSTKVCIQSIVIIGEAQGNSVGSRTSKGRSIGRN